MQPGSLPDFSVESRLHKTETARAAVGPAPGDQPLDKLVENYERDVISATLEQNHYSLTRSAEQLKLSRHALRYRMQRLNLSTGTEDDEIVAPGKNTHP